MKSHGLTVITEDASSTGYLPVDLTAGLAWIIDDENEAAKVVQAMIDEGVSVKLVEVD